MAIKYKIVELKPNSLISKGNNQVYSGRFVQSGKITLYQLAKEISDKSSFAHADVIGVVSMIAQVATDYLTLGMGVDLGELGSLSLDLESETTNSKEKFTSRNIKRAKVRFTPSMEVKNELKRAKFEPVE